MIRAVLQDFYKDYTAYIHTFVVLFYFVATYYVREKKIHGYIYSGSILLIVMMVILIGWYAGIHKLDELRTKSCVIKFGVNNKTFTNGMFFDGCFDIWHITHVLLWMLLGVITPHQYGLAILISVIWEVIEHIQFSRDGSCITPVCGRFEDLPLNMLGYVIGSYLSLTN